MKQQLITSVIKKRFSNIQQYSSQMLFDFAEEAIHDFRTEIKKLRAFLRLLNTGGNKDQLNISKKIKVYYWYAGSIRNLQLHIKNLNGAAGDKPILYIQRLKKEIESLQGALRSLHSPTNLDKPKKIIRNWIAEPPKPSVKKFVLQKVDHYQHLLTLIKQDEILHALRKLLKDLLYTWKYIKSYRSLLPVAISTKNKIEKLTDALGEFLDRVTGIHLLESYLFATHDPSDKHMLEKLMSKWNTEKNELRLKIYSLLDYSPA